MTNKRERNETPVSNTILFWVFTCLDPVMFKRPVTCNVLFGPRVGISNTSSEFSEYSSPLKTVKGENSSEVI